MYYRTIDGLEADLVADEYKQIASAYIWEKNSYLLFTFNLRGIKSNELSLLII